MSSQQAGTYSLRLEVDPEDKNVSSLLSVRVEQDVARLRTMLLALIMLLALPIGIGIYNAWFEIKRWQDSEFPIVKVQSGSTIVSALDD